MILDTLHKLRFQTIQTNFEAKDLTLLWPAVINKVVPKSEWIYLMEFEQK